MVAWGTKPKHLTIESNHVMFHYHGNVQKTTVTELTLTVSHFFFFSFSFEGEKSVYNTQLRHFLYGVSSEEVKFRVFYVIRLN